VHFVDPLVSGGGRGCHYVAIHITACRKGGHQRLVDGFHQGAQSRLDDTMELDALPRCQSQGVIGVVGGQIIVNLILVWRHDPASDPSTDHKHVMFACFAFIAVILLVDAVKFQKLPVIIGKAIYFRVAESGCKIACQKGIVFLEDFVVR
jgi:hypothetical protein